MKDLKISKELLSEVLSKKVDEISVHTGFVWFKHSKFSSNINTYELAFKCKEWMINKGYHINTSEDKINNYIYLYKMIKNDFGYEIDKNKGVQFDSKGYINNLFEACEWILENKDNK